MGKKEHKQSNFLGDDSKQNSQGREKDKDLNQNRDMEKMSLHSSRESKTEWHSKKEDRGMDSVSQVSDEVKSMKKDGKKIPEKGLTLKKKLKDHGLTISGDVVLRDLKKKESGKKKRKTWVLIKKTASSRKADKASSLNERIRDMGSLVLDTCLLNVQVLEKKNYVGGHEMAFCFICWAGPL
ncbi:hypothetical protein QQP08_024880 [Theobroma cacao]|nr:hypothetical protein QQP08_024880 [Theobroma cacao]